MTLSQGKLMMTSLHRSSMVDGLEIMNKEKILFNMLEKKQV